MKKKLLSLGLASLMAVGLLAGCGGSSSGGSTASTASTEAAGSTTEAAGSTTEAAGATSDGETTTTAYGTYSADNPYELTFAYIEFYKQDDAARDAVEAALNEYMIPTYHIKVDMMNMEYANYQQTIQLAISGGDKIDVIPIYYTYASSWIGMNGLVDMSPYMSTEDGQKVIDALGEETAWVGQTGGVLFGFPAAKESVELGGLWMRKDICDELGLAEEYGMVADQDEYTGLVYDWSVAGEIFEKVKAAKPDMIPLYMSGNSSQTNRFMFHDSLADNFGVLNWEHDHDDTTVTNLYESEEYKTYVTRLADWFDKGYIYQDAATDQQGSAAMIKAGNTFSYATAIKPGFLAEAKGSNGMDGYVLYFGNNIEGGISTTNVSFFDTGIATNSDDPDMAFKFIAAMYSDPMVMNLWQYGIEGVNYQVLDDGTAYFVDGEDAANYKYHQTTGWCQGNQFISYVWNDGTKDANYWDKLSHHNDWADYSPAYGFMWDATAYQTQLTALQNALETYRGALETGSVGSANVESTLKSLNDALYAAGLQTVMDAKQEQLDAWLTTNGATETPAANVELIEGAKATYGGPQTAPYAG